MAKRYSALHAAASCAHLMDHNPGLPRLGVCIARALGEPAHLESLVPRMLELYRAQRPFSLLSP